MSTLTVYEVTPKDDGGWAIRAEGSSRATAVEERKADAVERARELAHNKEPSKVVVYKQDGTVQTSYSYGDVPAETDGESTTREGRTGRIDAAYALLGLATDALELAGEAMEVARSLPGKAQDRGEQLRDLKARRVDLEQRIGELRETAESRFDEKATRGRSVAERISTDDRVRRIVDQAETARSQVKAAITSLRKTGTEAVSGALRAGREQASTAQSQSKAAVTSVRKTAEAAVDAGRQATDR